MPITRIIHLELLGFLYALAAVVVYQMLTRRINLGGLLSSKDGSGGTSPERIQLLLATIAVCARYLSESAHATGGIMPDIPSASVYLMGGSSTIYIARKAWATWTASSKQED